VLKKTEGLRRKMRSLNVISGLRQNLLDEDIDVRQSSFNLLTKLVGYGKLSTRLQQ